MKTNSLEIYVHIPFCERKCDYCDFVSFKANEDDKRRYFQRLNEQIKMKAEFTRGYRVDSVFFGGGTPSTANASDIGSVLKTIRTNFFVSSDAEITIEVNPNSVTKEKLLFYKEIGINRISIGLQSANNDELRNLSRIHTYEEFLESYKLIRMTGFNNVNIDIMSALPGQSFESYMDTLQKVVFLKPEHISAYSLIIEENTPFFKKYASGDGLVDEETERRMYHETKRFLWENGYERYEISNYCKPGFECRHNVGYWTRTPYLGFGIAAASLYEEKRYQMHKDFKRFLNGDFCEEIEKLSRDDVMEEFMFLGLRLTCGVSKKDFLNAFFTDIHEEYDEAIKKLTSLGLMEEDEEHIFLTDMGMDVANTCMVEFMR